jgi:putative membrane protein
MESHSYHGHSESASAFVALLVVAGLLILYLVAVVRQNRSGRHWNSWRTASFGVGTALLFVALTPPLADLSHHDLRAHMLRHLLVGMLAPLGLVLGAPLTLAFRTLPVQASRSITTILHNRLVRWLIHPVSAFVSNIGGMYLLYITPLYALTLTNPSLHYFMHLHFLIAGCLFTWAIAGPDPAPDRPSRRTRLIVLFLSIAAHATLAKFMYIYLWPPGTPHGTDEIRAAAQLMYYGGDVAELLLVIALFATWYGKHGQYHSTLQQRTLRINQSSAPN